MTCKAGSDCLCNEVGSSKLFLTYACFFYQEKKKLEQERLKALDSIRQKEDEETEEELNLINNTRLILKEKNRTNPEVLLL